MQNILTLLSPVRWRPVRSFVTPNLLSLPPSLSVRPPLSLVVCGKP